MNQESWMPAMPWSMPGGQQVASADLTRENRQQWLDLRRAMICASDVAALVGVSVSKYGDQYTVWADKTNRAAPEPTTRAQYRGLVFEDAILKLWAEHDIDWPIRFRRMGLVRSRRFPHLGATVDRLSVCELGRCLVEVKSAFDTTEWEDDEVPVAFAFQGQTQLAATGRHHVHFVGMDSRFGTMHRLMMRDEELIAEIGGLVEPWWQRHIVDDEVPTPTHLALDCAKRMALPDPDAIRIITEELAPYVLNAKTARAIIKTAETERDDALAVIYAAMGEASVLKHPDTADGPGEIELTWNAGKTIDGADKPWRAAHPDLVAAYSVPTTGTELDVRKMVENHPELIEQRELRYRRTTSWKK